MHSAHIPHDLADRDRDAVRAMADRHGSTRTARMIGIDPTTVGKILRGETICRGTAALVRAQLIYLALGPLEQIDVRYRCGR